MSFIKYALPALVAAQAAFAAECGSDGKSISITSQADADAYATCKTVKGNIVLDEHFAGEIIFNGIEQIGGGFSCDGGSNISSISAPQLNAIGSAFHLNGLTTLTSLSFASLSSVGSIDWTALPQLQTLDFTAGVNQSDSVSIINTGLTTLSGISLTSVGEFDITSNLNLKTVNVDNLKNATGLINFAGNLNSLEVSLPNLVGGTNMTFRNVSSVSFPALTSLSGQLGFWGNSFASFYAPNLTETADLVFNDNPLLDNITMPVLQTVTGGMQINHNDELTSISFPDLETVTGAVYIAGGFNEVELPKLQTVKGGFTMLSSGNFTCSTINSLKSIKTIRGTATCTDHVPNSTVTGSSTSTGSSASATKSSAAEILSAANLPVMGMAAALGALLQYAL